MSTRQYIGARYMPRFVGQFDLTQSYETLDVVDNGSGTTYIARIPTPAGTPLTDTTHWLVYGSSSGAILDLQGRVTTLENKFPVELDDLSQHMIVLGDSFTSPVRYSVTWADYVAENLGCTLHNFASDGASYTGAGGYKTLGQELNEAIADTTIPPMGVKYVFILAGVNEINFSGTLSGIATNATSLFSAIRSNYPKAQIICLGSNQKTRFAGDAALNPYSINNTLRTVLTDMGIPLYPLTNIFYGMPVDSSGHPTSEFLKTIAKGVMGLVTGSGFSRQPANENVDIVSSGGATITGAAGLYVTDKLIRMQFTMPTITLAAADTKLPTIVAKNPYDILTNQMIGESSYKPYVAGLNGLKNFGTGMIESSDRITFYTVGDAPAAATNGGLWADITFFTDPT